MCKAKKTKVDERNVLRFGLREHIHFDSVDGCACFCVEIIGFVDRIICKRLLLRSGECTEYVAVFVEKSERAVYVFFGVEANGIRARAVCGVEVCRDS